MSVAQSDGIERSMLDGKDRDQLVAIASAIGVKTAARASKATIIDKILEQTSGAPVPADAPKPKSRAKAAPVPTEALAVDSAPEAAVDPAPETPDAVDAPAAVVEASSEAPRERVATVVAPVVPPVAPTRRTFNSERPLPPRPPMTTGTQSARPPQPSSQGQPQVQNGGQNGVPRDDADSEGRRRRRRNRGRNRNGGLDGAPGDERDEFVGNDEPAQLGTEDPVDAQGYLDLRDEGYGFLRVKGYLSSRDDAYVSVKQTRQYGLRKGDFVTGTIRPAGRNEKNAALNTITSINGREPDTLRGRPRFEDLTALFPDQKLKLEALNDPNNATTRIIDLIAPIGKGQRGLIVSPPKAGKTVIMKNIVTAIERNHPEVKVIVLLIDERPEEVTDMRRTVKGEVVASTFDRPSEEHTQVAELVIERAKRLVEMGDDVLIILDGITRLARAYNLVAPATGRIMSGGIDAGALYPPKKFFGAARNTEEGGSLTILATALVDTNSRMDDAIFEEFKGTGNMELRLDRRLAERRIYPAIDIDASSTRREDLLFDKKQLQQVWKLRRVVNALEGGQGIELLVDRLKQFRTNDQFLDEIAKQP